MRWLDGIIDSMDMSFESTLGDSERRGCKESDKSEQLNNKNLRQ